MRRSAVITLGLAAVATLSSCTADPAPAPAPATSRPTTSSAPAAVDRDEQAVLATLAGLDMCKLVDVPSGWSATASWAHDCHVESGDHRQAFKVEVRPRRTGGADLPKRVIEGAKVDAEHSEPTLCSVDIPLSFELAIRVTEYSGDDGCVVAVEERAAGVVKRLGAPDKARVAADRPDFAKDACSVVDSGFVALGKRSIERTTGGYNQEVLDVCGRDTDGIDVELRVSTGSADGGKPWHTVEGRPVRYVESTCALVWSEGAYDKKDDRTFELAGECRDGHPPDKLPVEFVAAVIKELEKPVTPPAPMRLTYRPDEPDRP